MTKESVWWVEEYLCTRLYVVLSEVTLKRREKRKLVYTWDI